MDEGNSEAVAADARVDVGFDHHSHEVGRDPYAAYEKLRNHCPVAWSAAHDGFWVLSDYASVSQATKNDDVFRSGPYISIPPAPTVHPLIPIETDAPLAQKYRRLVSGSLSPVAVAQLEPEMRVTVSELIDGFIGSGCCDLAGDLALPTAAITSLRWLGFEDTHWREFVKHDHKLGHELSTDVDGAMESAIWLFGQTAELISARRESPRDDVISWLIDAKVDGEPLDEMSVINYVLNLLVGGLETTASTFCNAMVRLDRDRELRRQLIEEPGCLPTALEEFLRMDGSVQGLGRSLSRDFEFGGMRMCQGERVQLLWASANRDPKRFPDPDRFDPRRRRNQHLAFGVGLHRCLGAHLARSMLRILFHEILQRMPDFELVGDVDEWRYPDAGLLYAVHTLHARFTPAEPRQEVRT